ncbi:hypothetical protein [Bacillus altitudinis]|uniref:hypothetical protein n=1 Tax=Bacillus altitudinis TaxID=293387 RepID=UPI0020D1D898|nr:hypothetical protein [Bacillus altitudinis]
MPIGKQLKRNLTSTNTYEKKHNEFLKGIEEFKAKKLQAEYERVQTILEKSLQRA